jgi:hypothetical protein
MALWEGKLAVERCSEATQEATQAATFNCFVPPWSSDDVSVQQPSKHHKYFTFFGINNAHLLINTPREKRPRAKAHICSADEFTTERRPTKAYRYLRATTCRRAVNPR